jgi:biopolymer transport protein ExbD
MSLKTVGSVGEHAESAAFNMTPIIDIVFLLIIFFLVICQFIEAENFPVTVPDDCGFAQREAQHQGQITTVTVMKTDEGISEFAVGSEKILASSSYDLVERMAQSIDVSLSTLPADRRVVILRIDKDTSFSQAQYTLAGIAASSATDIQLAALKNKRSN